MQASEIPGFVGRIVGYREHTHILPNSAYLLSGDIFGSQRDPVRGCAMYVLSKSRQSPQRAAGRMAWTFGWPILTVTASTGARLIEGRRFLDTCQLKPGEVFEQDRNRGILYIVKGVLPASVAVTIVHDARMLVPPTGKNLSGTRAEKMPKLEDED